MKNYIKCVEHMTSQDIIITDAMQRLTIKTQTTNEIRHS